MISRITRILLLSTCTGVAASPVRGQAASTRIEVANVKSRGTSINAALTVGEATAGPSAAFGAVGDGVLFANGGLLVSDKLARELREFASDGRYVSTWGRRGRGPGEFESIAWLTAVAGDSVFVYDRSQRRVTVWQRGKAARQVLMSDLPASSVPTDLVGVLRNRSFVARRAVAEPSGVGAQRPTEELVILREGMPVRSLGRFLGDEVFYRVSSSGGKVLGLPPFQRKNIVAIGAATIAVGDTESGEVRLFSEEGRLLKVFILDVNERELSESVITARLNRISPRGQSPAVRPQWETLQREMISTKRSPAFEAIKLDTDDRLWVLQYDRTQKGIANWVVISPKTSAVEFVSSPADCDARIIAAATFVCVSRGTQDEPELVFAKISRRDPARAP